MTFVIFLTAVVVFSSHMVTSYHTIDTEEKTTALLAHAEIFPCAHSCASLGGSSLIVGVRTTPPFVVVGLGHPPVFLFLRRAFTMNNDLVPPPANHASTGHHWPYCLAKIAESI
jgi:hypothetical protein